LHEPFKIVEDKKLRTDGTVGARFAEVREPTTPVPKLKDDTTWQNVRIQREREAHGCRMKKGRVDHRWQKEGRENRFRPREEQHLRTPNAEETQRKEWAMKLL